MSTESAVAYVSIIPQARGVGKQIEKEINPDAVGTSVGEKVGARLATALGKTLQAGATTVVAAGAAAIGAALVKGFNRLTAIDQATAKLKGLGNSASDITKIMDNALAAVRGTAFGLDSAAGVAAGAVAAGIAPGEKLQRVLGLVADSATIAGTDLASMGSIFNKVAASGKLQGDVIAQLQDAGVPVLQFVSKEIGKTAAETSKLASDGKIDFETFANAMEAGLGGAAKSSGDTFTGALANVGASLGRIGANLEKGFFPKLSPLLQQITAVMGPLEDRATAIGEAIGAKVNPALDRLSSLLTNGTDAFKGMSSVLAPLGGLFLALGAGGLGSLLAMLPGIGGLAGPLAALGGPLGLVAGALGGLVAVSPQLQAALTGAASSVSQFASTVGGAFGPILRSVLASFGDLVQVLGVVLAVAVNSAVPVVLQLAGVLGGALAPLLPVISELLGTLGVVLTNAAPLIAVLAGVVSQLVTALAPLIVAVASGLANALSAVLPFIADLSARLVPLAGWVNRNSDLVIGLGLAVLGGVVAYKAWTAATQAVNAVQQILIARTYGAAGATYAQATAGRVATVVNRGYALSARVAAVAQGLFNGALRANPIGLIITAVGALVAGLVWFFTQTKAGQAVVKTVFSAIRVAVIAVGDAFVWLWKNAIQPALGAIGGAVSALWTDWISPVFQLIGGIFSWLWSSIIAPTANLITNVVVNGIGAAFSWLWVSVIRPVFGWIGAVFTAWWATVVQPVFGFVIGLVRNTLGPVFSWLYRSIIQPVFSGIGTVVRSVWTGWLKPVFDKIIDIAKNTVPSAFSAMKDGIGKAWDLVKAVVKAPIKFVVETVIRDGIIGNFNKLADVFGTKHLPKVELPKGFAGGGYTGAGGKFDPAGIVHKGEFVFTKEQTARLGVGRLYDIARNGYAGGGFVSDAKKNVSAGWDWLAGKAGKAWDWARNAAKTAASIVSDPMGTLGKLVKGMIGKVPGAGVMVDIAKGVGSKLLSGVIDKIKSLGSDAGSFGGNGKNGQIPSSALAKVAGFVPGPGVGATGGLLRKSAAAAWDRAYAASGNALRLTEGYRDLKAQQYRWSLYQRGGNLAAPVGSSVHGLGLAADVAGGQAWLRANGAKYGWVNTGLGFAQREPWHFEFKGVPQLAAGAFIKHTPGGSTVTVGEGRYDEAVVPMSPGFKDSLLGTRNSEPTNGEFTGNLYLDSGEFLGLVRGEIKDASKARALALQTGRRIQ